jgi:hypothetical protein
VQPRVDARTRRGRQAVRRGGLRNGIDFTVRPVIPASGGQPESLGAFVSGYLIHDFSGALTFTPDASTFKNERCGGVNVLIIDRAAFDPVRTGLEIAAALRRLHPEAWKVDGYGRLLASKAVLDAIRTGGDPQGVVDLSAAGLREFHARRTPHLLYD